MSQDIRLRLPQVTLCAVTSVNVQATLRALEICLADTSFAACKLLTDAKIDNPHPEIEIVPIKIIGSSAAYSDFLLNNLVDHVQTSHCLVAQWDGYVLNAQRWRRDFLNYDYIGATWPQFEDGYDVGNGGFSLRSRKLMLLCKDKDFIVHHPEDISIGRTNRAWLEQKGIHFAPRDLADLFSSERAGDFSRSFGYHGVWNMPQAVGSEIFWKTYRELDDRGTLQRDFIHIVARVLRSRGGFLRAVRMLANRLSDFFCETTSSIR